VPVGTPVAVVQRLQAAVAKAFEEQEMKDLWFKLGAEAGGAPTEEFRTLVSRDVAKWATVVREAKISVD
jgi:tripartite-type tricarboxylate transporter receptor subunit TctC